MVTPRTVELSAEESDLVVSALPDGGVVLRAAYLDNYDRPCPVKVDVRTADGNERSVVLRIARHGDVAFEATVLIRLAQLGLPVPEVLAPPVHIDGRTIAVYSMLGGSNLQQLALQTDNSDAVKDLVIDAVDRLAELTEAMGASRLITTIRLSERLERSIMPGLPWTDVLHSQTTLLAAKVRNVAERLVFSNGDYQAANFLSDGQSVTGFVDFEKACVTDLLYGFAKYRIYDLHPLNSLGLVSRALERFGSSEGEFAPRVGVACVETLQREIPVGGGSAHEVAYRDHVVSLLNSAVAQ